MSAEDREPAATDAPSARPSGSVGGGALLAALAVAAQGCSVRLIDVRPYAVFQHYAPWGRIAAEHQLAAGVLLVQTVVVAGLTWRMRAGLRRVLAGPRSIVAWLVALALAGASLSVPTESVSRTAGEMALAGGLAVIAALNLALAAAVLPDSALARAESWLDARVTLRPGSASGGRWDRVLPWGVALWVTVLAAAVSHFALERVPHIDDSISNYFQARYFAAGHLYLPAPPDTASFQVDQTVVDGGRWYGYAFPVWPAVLAVGVRLGAPWLVNPVLGGLLVLVTHALLRRRFDRGTANAAVLLLGLSPWLIFMSAEYMAHPVTGVLVVVAMLAFDRASARDGAWAAWAALAGASAGALMLTRAIDGAIVLAALAAGTLIDRRFVRALPATALTGVAAVAVAALALPYNAAVTGRATYPPHMAWSDSHWGPGVDRLGFGPDVGIRAWPNLDPLPGHGLPDVVLNINKNLFMTNFDLFGWAAGSLVFVWLAFALRGWRRADAQMLAVCAAYMAGYSTYWFSGGPDLGARYWYPTLVPLAALTARGAQIAGAALAARRARPHAGARVGAFVVAASLGAAAVVIPWRAVTKHWRYRGIGAEVRELAASRHFEHALVFVRSEGNRRDFAAAFNFNPWTLEDPATVYALDAGPEHRAAVVAHFPDRPVWIVGRPREGETDRGPLEVVAGPLPPGTAPR